MSINSFQKLSGEHKSRCTTCLFKSITAFLEVIFHWFACADLLPMKESGQNPPVLPEMQLLYRGIVCCLPGVPADKRVNLRAYLDDLICWLFVDAMIID